MIHDFQEKLSEDHDEYFSLYLIISDSSFLNRVYPGSVYGTNSTFSPNSLIVRFFAFLLQSNPVYQGRMEVNNKFIFYYLMQGGLD